MDVRWAVERCRCPYINNQGQRSAVSNSDIDIRPAVITRRAADVAFDLALKMPALRNYATEIDSWFSFTTDLVSGEGNAISYCTPGSKDPLG